MILKRGEIYYADLRQAAVGSEQGGIRPVLIIQNDIGNKYSPTTIVAVITSKDKKELPTHVTLHKSSVNGLTKDSTILLEQLKTIDKCRILEKVGKITKNETELVREALGVSLLV